MGCSKMRWQRKSEYASWSLDDNILFKQKSHIEFSGLQYNKDKNISWTEVWLYERYDFEEIKKKVKTI